MLLVAASCRSRAARGIDSLDVGHTSERALALIGFGLQQQPRNRVRTRGICALLHLPGNSAAVGCFPTWTLIVLADFCVLFIQKIGVRPRQYPLELGGIFGFRFARVDLAPFSQR